MRWGPPEPAVLGNGQAELLQLETLVFAADLQNVIQSEGLCMQWSEEAAQFTRAG